MLLHVRQAGRSMDAASAAALGAAAVQPGEVAAAIKQMQPGKAPGVDGLPGELYRKFKVQFVPLLARLFSAVGSMQATPLGFSHGAISVLFKKGDRADPANYRPITLLNVDYRLLAKVLSNRLLPCLDAVIDPMQTAFLKGRHIGDSIMLLQVLPDALKAESKGAVMAFLDFAKAYDTVDRQFMLNVMRDLGVGPGFLSWVRTLLHATQSCAVVNGYTSRLFDFHAGVRQGCPLAPLLYLFVGQALQSFLAAKGYGVELAGRRVLGSQYADDTEVLLAHPQAATQFLQDMKTFAAASGQCLNTSKTEMLLLGHAPLLAAWQRDHLQPAQPQVAGQPPPRPRPLSRQQWKAQQRAQQQEQQQLQQLDPFWRDFRQMLNAQPPMPATFQQQQQMQPLQLAGCKVVQSATALGISVSNDATSAAVDWPCTLAAVEVCFDRISRMGLSAFGRAAAVSGYGISKLQYHVEFAGLPPAEAMAQLQRHAARLVVTGKGPSDTTRAFVGVKSELLQGHPRVGGFGAMPVRQHFVARHARWFARLLTASDTVPWVHVARTSLAHNMPYWQHPLGVLIFPGGHAGMTTQPQRRALSRPLQRLLRGMQALPPLQLVSADKVQPGAWCWGLPLWRNPALRWQAAAGGAASGSSSGGGGSSNDAAVLPCLEAAFPDLAYKSDIRSLGTALRVQRELEQLRPSQGCDLQRQYEGSHSFTVLFHRRQEFSCLQRVKLQLQALLAAIPASWVAAARQVQRTPPSVHLDTSMPHALAAITPGLGWVAADGSTVLLQSLSVSAATQLQLQPITEERTQRMQAFVRLALEEPGQQQPAAEAVDAAVHELQRQLGRVWRGVRWENSNKEVYWRLLVDGLPTPQRLHTGEPCLCGGAVAPGRDHVYWGCPVAVAVRQQLEGAMPGVQLSRAAVWLMRAPQGIHVGVWRVVCLAALSAMDYGRKQLHRLDNLQQCSSVARQQATVVPMLVVPQMAATMFWALLQDFAVLGAAPRGWGAVLGASHPFLHWLSPFGPRLRLHRPAVGP